MRENMRYLSFWVCLIFYNIMVSSSTHFPTNDIISFFFMAEYSIGICTTFYLSEWIKMKIGWFHSFTVVNSAVIRGGLHYNYISVLLSLGKLASLTASLPSIFADIESNISFLLQANLHFKSPVGKCQDLTQCPQLGVWIVDGVSLYGWHHRSENTVLKSASRGSALWKAFLNIF
jgi:hypothetical protein